MKKLNKKGFTLVELLAVIVVLALLMVVAASSIGSALKNSKKSATKTEAQKIIRQLYQDNKSLSLTGSLSDAGTEKTDKDGKDFSYNYKYATTGAITSFCLKHSDGYWVTGTVDENGKEDISDPVETKPSASNIDAHCENSKGETITGTGLDSKTGCEEATTGNNWIDKVVGVSCPE